MLVYGIIRNCIYEETKSTRKEKRNKKVEKGKKEERKKREELVTNNTKSVGGDEI